MPRIRFGQVHIVNCLYSSTVANYCVGTGYRCNAYIEKCAFINQKHPWKNYATSGSYTDYNITVTDCVGAKDEQSHSGDIDYFNPHAVSGYTLTAYGKELVETVVKEGAGTTLTIAEGQKYTTALTSTAANLTSVTDYYLLSGAKVSHQSHGICIGVGKDAAGKPITKKLYR